MGYGFFLPFLSGALVSAEAAIAFTSFGVLGSASFFPAMLATRLLVCSSFLVMVCLLGFARAEATTTGREGKGF